MSEIKLIMKLLLILLLAATILAGPEGVRLLAGTLPNDGQVSLETLVARDSIRVGERLRIRFQAEYPDSFEFHPASRMPEGKYRLVSMNWSRKPKGGLETARGDLVVFTLDLEEAYLPPVELFFLSPSGDTLMEYTDEIHVPVRLVAGEAGEMKPLKSQWEAPRSYLVPALLAMLALAAVLAFLLWRRRSKQAGEVEPARPVLPPDFVALRELGKIEKSGLLDRGEFREYYTRVVDVMRRYIEGRFGVDAMDMTTEEILQELAGCSGHISELEEFLGEADLVKFAKYIPGMVPGKRLVDKARQIVVETTPPKEPASEAAHGG